MCSSGSLASKSKQLHEEKQNIAEALDIYSCYCFAPEFSRLSD